MPVRQPDQRLDQVTVVPVRTTVHDQQRKPGPLSSLGNVQLHSRLCAHGHSTDARHAQQGDTRRHSALVPQAPHAFGIGMRTGNHPTRGYGCASRAGSGMGTRPASSAAGECASGAAEPPLITALLELRVPTSRVVAGPGSSPPPGGSCRTSTAPSPPGSGENRSGQPVPRGPPASVSANSTVRPVAVISAGTPHSSAVPTPRRRCSGCTSTVTRPPDPSGFRNY